LKTPDWIPGDRFPPSDWMTSRLSKPSMPPIHTEQSECR
jgi:hypothetical protein